MELKFAVSVRNQSLAHSSSKLPLEPRGRPPHRRCPGVPARRRFPSLILMLQARNHQINHRQSHHSPTTTRAGKGPVSCWISLGQGWNSTKQQQEPRVDTIIPAPPVGWAHVLLIVVKSQRVRSDRENVNQCQTKSPTVLEHVTSR